MGMILTRRYNVDRFGYLVPHRYGNLPMLGAVATFRPGEGRFGRGAVAVEEGTVNLCAESSYSAYATTNLGLVTMDTPHGRQEVFEFALISGFSTARAHKSFSIEAGKTYTVSFVAKAEKPYARMSIGSIKFWPEGGATADYTLGPILSKELGNGWTYFSQSVSISSTNRDSMSLMAVMSDALPGDKAWVYNFQAEEKPFATSFVDRTRAGGVLTYDASIMPVQSATVAAWVWVPPSSHWPTSDFRRIISNHNSSALSRAIILYFSPGNRRLYLHIRDDASMQQVISTPSSITEGWHHIAATWDVSRMALYVDGILVAQQTNPSLPTSHPNPWIAVGARTDNRDHLNSLIDELLILPYAASEEEIRAWYEADGPIPPHPQATLQWDWQAVRPATMVAL